MFFLVIILAGGGYWFYQDAHSQGAVSTYVLAKVTKDTLISTVSGSGQMAASNQVDLKAKASGKALYVGVIQGQEVKSGALLVQLDTREAQKSVRDAQANLASAELAMEKLQQPADQLSLLQQENSLAQAEENKQTTLDDLEKDYDDGFNSVANAFLDLPDVMNGLTAVLFGTDLSTQKSWNMNFFTDSVKSYDPTVEIYRQSAENSYLQAQEAYEENFNNYKVEGRFSDTEAIENLIDQTYNTTKKIAEAIKNSNNLIQFYLNNLANRNIKPSATVTAYLADLNSYTSQTNNHLSSLLSIKRAIQTGKEDIINADRTIAERTQSLADLKAGTDQLDLKSEQLSLKQRQNALLDAQEKLADYYIRAPFAGVAAQVEVKKGDDVSSGLVAITLITKQQLAEISLNEVDAAKVKAGQKATLTFDAVPDLTLTGSVVYLDAVGTVSQGVSSYVAKIAFDAQDDRVKPGMSVSASIITEVKSDALLVPNTALKIQGESYYVEMPDSADPALISGNQSGVVLTLPTTRKTVLIGSANDEFTEIISGLAEGENIISNTLSAVKTTATQTSAKSGGFSIPGLTGGGPGR